MKKIFLSFFLYSGILSSQTSAIFPDSIDVWIAEGVHEIYEGEDLYKLINGGADIFNEYGFNKVITHNYTDSNGRQISVEAYEMNDSASAFGIFSLFTFNTGKPVVFKTDAYAGDEFFLFQKGNYYVSLSGNESSPEIQTGLNKIASEIEKNIKPSGKPVPVNKFNDLEYSRIAYIKGNLALYNLRSIDSGRNFNVEEGICIKYKNSLGTVFMYKSEVECRRNFSSLINHLKKNSTNEPAEKDHLSYLIKDQEGKYSFIRLIENFIVISTSEDKKEASETADKIKQAIN